MRELSDAELTKIYNDANGIGAGKSPPISTQKIFTAMRAVAKAQRKLEIEEGIANMVKNGKCAPDGDLAKILRKLG